MAEEQKPGEKKAEEKKSTRRPSALKRDIQSEKRRVHNKAYRARTLTELRALESALTKKEKPLVQEHLKRLYSLMDKGVKTGIFKQNKANRIKARFSKRALTV
jgi:small subunit ribosomal protein S20